MSATGGSGYAVFPTYPVNYISDWPGRLQGLLYEQYKNDPSWIAWCNLIGRQAQDLEDALQSMTTRTVIMQSQGPQLDTIGRIVGQPRAGFDDASYQLLLLARIAANRSSGLSEQIYLVMSTLMGPVIAMRLTRSPVKQFLLEIFTPISDVIASATFGLLQEAKAATDRAVLEWQALTDDQMFVFAQGSQLLQAAAAGATGIAVVDTSPFFTPTGFLRISQGMSGTETVRYTVSGPTGLGVDTLTFAHATGSRVEVATGTTGLGFAVGAQLASAAPTGATSLTLVGTTGMTGSSGTSLVLDAGEPAEEIAVFVVTGPQTVSVSVLTKSHPTGCTAAVLGFGGGLGSAVSPTGHSTT